MALSTPEMSQLLEAATRLFLFMCHSVIEESSSSPCQKGQTSPRPLHPPWKQPCPKQGGWSCLSTVQGWLSALGTPSPLESLGKLLQT